MDWEFIEQEIEQEALEAAQAARRRISERRAARRKRQRRRRIAQAAAVGAVAVFAIGMAVTSAATQGSRTPALSAPLPSPEICAPAPTASSYIGPTATPEPTPEATTAVKLLESVPLDAETQAAILELCGGDRDTFCAIMAIAWVESRFDTDEVGDNGVSIGMMQVNTRWHTGRMEALGVTDLTDPVQCAAVALDYLRELSEGYGFGWITDHDLYMAYNMGPGNARIAIDSGTASSGYSRAALTAYGDYAQEMEAAQA